ncbi:TetR/AcrR family transcriptional regulator [Acaryochloris sp. 'Moss Beach']|uniref:TetR/AcrR family transcriptional regulator n=1 Tax=Acaryochloris sp. 'Moss Beach' TaxID=2740837 RepID=UPI001F380BCF|nr:TetR/AcrR family transcriptional regulator [Acaryochloris sp. 'Moss Beach']UJB70083.1 TetR/AcrR family transcriptional regulator [Acaryochloris sp. 'Moss Beach']
MPSQSSTRQRLIQSAFQLFITQGISGTTTRQIAEAAEVNEVTLFRHFGSKHGLLLGVLEESTAFQSLGQALNSHNQSSESTEQAFQEYASYCLHALEQVPDLIRSLVGEANQYPADNRLALGKRMTEITQYMAQYLETFMAERQLIPQFSTEKLASLLECLLLGYAVIEFTSEYHQLWNHQDDFLEHAVQMILFGSIASGTVVSPSPQTTTVVADLPAETVHLILRQAKKQSTQDHALAYVLFGAGLSSPEVIDLLRSQQISNNQQHLLQIQASRQVAVNQWVMGKRLGSYTSNPLTKWLKFRKDDEPTMFVDDQQQPLTLTTLADRWKSWTEGMTTLAGHPPHLEQAQHTWCIDMLMRGVTLDNLSLLTGWTLEQLHPYDQRAKEKAALEQATRLDQKPSSKD